LAVAAQQLVASATSTLEARKRATRLLGWGFVTGVVLAALLYVIPPSLLTDDARVAEEASIELLRIVAPLQLLSSLVFVGDGILQGSRDFKFEAFAVALASVGGAAVLILEQRPPDGALATACVEFNQCVGCTRQFFNGAAVLAWSSGKEPASPRHRAGVASMAWRTTRRFRTNAP